MLQNATIWIPLVLGALVMGASFVGILVATRRAEPLWALAGVAGFTLCSWAFGRSNTVYHRADALLYGLLFTVGGIGGGYALAASLLDRLVPRERRVQPPVSLSADAGSAAVLVLACTDPERYSPRYSARVIRDLIEQDVLTSSLGVLPFMFAADKARYRASGGRSPARAQAHALVERLSALLSPRFAEPVRTGCCGGDRLAIRVLDAVYRGHRTVVVAPVTIGESLDMASAKREVDALRLGDLGVRVVYADPLWGSERLGMMIASRVRSATADPSTTGVVLLGSGQAEPHARVNPLFDEHETAFLNRLRMRLVEAGYQENHVRVAWLEWEEPEVTGSVRHLAALGCRRVLVVPACLPFESASTTLDLTLAVKHAHVDEPVSVVTLPAWRSDDVLVEEVRARVERALDEALSPEA